MSELPVIDVGALASGDEAACRAVAREIGAACRDIGFFAIRGHGVPQGLVDDAFAAAAEFFALPRERKDPLSLKRHGHNRGYVALADEALDEKSARDLKEAFNIIWAGQGAEIGNVWPELPGWRERVQAHFDAVYAAGRRLHRAFALDLGLAEDFFDDKIDRPMATLRLLHYPAVFEADAPQGRAGAGTHTDYGNVTLLATDGVAGLQVRRRDGGWIAVPALPGAFVCNIGDCLMRWSNDVYVSTPHRVLPPARERYSIAFFLDPNADAVVAALPGTGAAKYPAVTAREHLQERFAATYGR